MKQVFTIAGQGGQGVLSIGMAIAKYMSEVGKAVTFAPIYGPQQRGGPAKCTVVVEEDQVRSPMAKVCDVLLCMNQNSVKTYEKDIKPDGLFIYNSNTVEKPTEREDVRKLAVAANDVAKSVGNDHVANSVMVGVLMHFFPDINREHFLSNYLKKYEKKGAEVQDINKKAFEEGLKIGDQITD